MNELVGILISLDLPLLDIHHDDSAIRVLNHLQIIRFLDEKVEYLFIVDLDVAHLQIPLLVSEGV